MIIIQFYQEFCNRNKTEATGNVVVIYLTFTHNFLFFREKKRSTEKIR